MVSRDAAGGASSALAKTPEPNAVYHLFVVRVARRDAFRAHLAARGIATAVHYPMPLHLQPAFRHWASARAVFRWPNGCAREVVSLPMHPFLERAEVQYIADAAAEFLRA